MHALVRVLPRFRRTRCACAQNLTRCCARFFCVRPTQAAHAASGELASLAEASPLSGVKTVVSVRTRPHTHACTHARMR
jgi:hypothetical protein